MPASDIVIKGAREHNLRDVQLSLPRNRLICLTGVSGSGKSSLAFDTLYAEGQRRYVESLSTFARQFLGQMPKPDVDYIGGLSPSISISQKTAGNNPRSTVGTITEIYDYLRLLYARVGDGHCPECDRPITAQSREQILERVLQLPEGASFLVLAPLIRRQKGEYKDLFEDLLKQGFARARVDGTVINLTSPPALDRQMRHDIEVVIDRLAIKQGVRPRLAEAIDLALQLGQGNLVIAGDVPKPEAPAEEGEKKEEETPTRAARGRGRRAAAPASAAAAAGDMVLSVSYACTHCGLSFEPPSPQLFSFNSPQGMCPDCAGLGEIFSFDADLLIPNPKLSFATGAIELVGPWKDLGRWKRHIYQGVADTIERKRELEAGTMLETPWKDLDPELRDLWLMGTGDEHITFTWRGGQAPQMYGGKYKGLIPEFLATYRESKSQMQLSQLEKYMRAQGCPTCKGERLNRQARAVRVTSRHADFGPQPGRTLPEVCKLPVSEASKFFQELVLDDTRTLIASEVLKEIRGRLGFLLDVGLDYLCLDRTAPTLSGGESQRIRLASQIGCGLVGVLYILDEPSIGLHPRDNDRLLATLARLRDQGNTVVVVEHDEDTMRAADHVIDFGPGPGVRGGQVVAEGPAAEVSRAPKSLTGKYLSGEEKIEVPAKRRPIGEKWLKVIGATHNNLKNITAEIPLGAFVCVTGVSGSGKSSLVNDIIVETLHRDLNAGEGHPGAFEKIEGMEHLDKLIAIDQSPIGRTPRSNPGTYIKVLDDIRDLYTLLPEAKRRGYKPGRFSFNVKGGRCEACEGNGSNRLEMDFLADVWVTCPVCEGHRFSRETLQVKFKGKSIAEVLEMDVQQALDIFENVPQVRHKLATLHSVGLDYVKLGQPSPTLSGGEAQRIKLARELVKRSTGRTLYLLDEPTTGLHFHDVRLLLKVLHDFADAGNTVLVVEHSLDVVKTADWIIDIGPEGGKEGGQVIVTGTPEEVARYALQAAASGGKLPLSHTGIALAKILGIKDEAAAKKAKPAEKPISQLTAPLNTTEIVVRGAKQHNLKEVDLRVPRDQMTVFCGPSGSGKSSLAMDTIYAEGQRRYVESLSSYARQFVGQMPKPAVEHVEGLSPAIAIEQKNLGHTPRSTVGTVTEIYDYLRILLARLGQPYCPDCQIPIGTQTSDQIVDKLLAEPAGTKLTIIAPLETDVGEKYESVWEELRAEGYIRVRVDGTTHSLDNPPAIDRRRKHKVEVVIDRAVVQPEARARLAESVEMALSVGRGVMHIAFPQENVPEPKWPTVIHSQHLACEKCRRSFEPLSPHSFSFNSSLGWCPACQGLGTQVGANPAALIRDAKKSLAEGALDLWPDLANPLAKGMLEALAAGTNLSLDKPFEQLNVRERRVILHGAGDQWFEVPGAKKSAPPILRFQFKGLYPTLEEASRLSPSLRARLEQFVGEVECSVCGGTRLRDDAAAVRFRERQLDELCRQPLGPLLAWFKNWKLSAREKKIAGELIREVEGRLQFLCDVGLEYLTIGRNANTLSNGEAQRIRLASQLGSGLCGVLYVLDEPTIGLHPRDNRRLLSALHKLRDLGNTLIVVEHDQEVIEGCDQLRDFGPGAGRHGGQVVAAGSPKEIQKQSGSVTGPYLSGKKGIAVPTNRRYQIVAEEEKPARKSKSKSKASAAGAASVAAAVKTAPAETAAAPSSSIAPPGWLEVVGARHNNLRNVDLSIPLGTLTAITGPSGSGKSSLVDDVLYAALARTLHRASTVPGNHTAIRGLENINKVIRVDQQPLGNSPTSNPATYTGVFDQIRNLFAQLPDAKLRGYSPRRFSFNVPGGRCEACEGNGQKRIEMHFLPDVWVQCETCRGQRYNPETLAVRFHGRSINDVLEMTCGDARQLFQNIPKIRRVLDTLCDVGLDYLTLGQSAPTLSGGEAQRVKLAAELSRPDTGRTLYLLDEPTTGLHFDDLAKLLEVLQRLVDLGNTVVVIEHNLDVIKCADWLVEMGPEAGEEGGQIVFAGTPEQLADYSGRALEGATGSLPAGTGTSGTGTGNGSGRRKRVDGPHEPLPRSHTGEALTPVLEAGPHRERKPYDPHAAEKEAKELEIEEVGRDVRMPWEVDGRRWHTQDRVGRNAQPCKWDGEILAKIVDRIHELGEFSPTDWSTRSVVEISAEKKSDGWFFHAITGETWLVKLKFRVLKNSFRRDDLVANLKLKPLNEMHDLPVYGNEPRVKCKNLRGPWQEVQIDAHALDEIDTPAFWKFLENAVQGFFKFTDKVAASPEDVMPWKKLGQAWHFSRKGFPPGKPAAWKTEVLEELCSILHEVAPDGQFLWNGQVMVHLMVPGWNEPWVTIHTKRQANLELIVNGPPSATSLGRIASLGADREVATASNGRSHAKIRFVTTEDLHRGDLVGFLTEHRTSLAK